MSLEINSAKASNLASELADATGEDLDTAVVRAIEERLARVARKLPPGKTDEVDALFERLAKMPVLDSRSPDEILDYGPNGLPH